MNDSSTAVTEMPAKPVTEVVRKGRSKEGKTARRTTPKAKANSRERYFLATGQPGDKVTIGRELASEQEALVTAFQEKVTFFVVTEYRVDTQFKGASALLIKEGVSRADS